jgi:hypothetical protein
VPDAMQILDEHVRPGEQARVQQSVKRLLSPIHGDGQQRRANEEDRQEDTSGGDDSDGPRLAVAERKVADVAQRDKQTGDEQPTVENALDQRRSQRHRDGNLAPAGHQKQRITSPARSGSTSLANRPT